MAAGPEDGLLGLFEDSGRKNRCCCFASTDLQLKLEVLAATELPKQGPDVPWSLAAAQLEKAAAVVAVEPFQKKKKI